jgi:hypothetical protein
MLGSMIRNAVVLSTGITATIDIEIGARASGE